jgi:hypothetical protein
MVQTMYAADDKIQLESVDHVLQCRFYTLIVTHLKTELNVNTRFPEAVPRFEHLGLQPLRGFAAERHGTMIESDVPVVPHRIKFAMVGDANFRETEFCCPFAVRVDRPFGIDAVLCVDVVVYHRPFLQENDVLTKRNEFVRFFLQIIRGIVREREYLDTLVLAFDEIDERCEVSVARCENNGIDMV